MTLPELFARTAREHAARPFIIDDAGTHSYENIARRIQRMADLLSELGVRCGDRVAVVMGNHGGYIVTWFALASLGAVLVGVNTELRGRTLREIIEDSAARTLVLDAALLDIVRGALGEDCGGRCVRVVEGPAQLFAELDARAPGAHEPEPFDDTQPLSILFTSGTTSRPKGALSTHRAYVLSGTDMARGLEVTANDRFMVFLPLFHANPQYYAVMSAVVAGASIGLVSKFSLSRFWHDVQRLDATLFTYVGTVLSLLRQAPPAPAGHRLRGCVGGGAPADAWRHVERWGVRVFELYGMTETAAFVTLNTCEDGRFGSVGRARTVTDVRTVLPDGHQAQPGEPGEIVVRATVEHGMFDGYVGPNGTLDDGRVDGWLHTGDMGTFDADGYLYFIGRAKDMMRVRGENISPAHVEGLLRDCSWVAEAAVIPRPSALGEDEIQLCVVPAGGADAATIYAWCLENLPRFMQPRYIELRESLPKTSTQKVERRVLIEHAARATVWERPGAR